MPLKKKQLLWKGILYSLQMEYFIRTRKTERLNSYRQQQTESIVKNKTEQELITYVAQIVRIIDKRMLWHPKCLNLALVAKRLLREVSIETTLHIGFKPKAIEKKVEGHAWLTIGNQLITGWLPDLKEHKELFSKDIFNSKA